MSEFNISIPGGQSKRLLTGGKYCPENILVAAEQDHTIEDAVISGMMSGDYYNDRITKIGVFVFYDKTGLNTFSAPNVVNVGGSAFGYNKTVKKVLLPKANELPRNMFVNCPYLEVIDIGISDAIWTESISNSPKLATIISHRTKLVSLTNVNLFAGTPFASGGTGGKVYVPSALIETYKTATNWSVLYGQGTCEFVALEGSEYE